jgi:hypothetical protein
MCKCGNRERRPGQRYCLECHAASVRKSRKNNQLNPLQRLKMNCRSYANTYLKRGKITRKQCQGCGDPKAQMHHPDYSKPLEVEWLCRPCHLALHEADSTTWNIRQAA